MTTQDTTFTIFHQLPTEIRLKIWALACFVPRTIDVWTSFKRCEVENTIFYCQVYLVELAPLPAPALLSTSREARAEALKHYSHEFRTFMKPSAGIEVTMHASWYVNWVSDVFVPRGYWNLVSFADFVSRGLESGLRRVAIDVSGVFWRENLRDYVLGKDCWALNGVQEVLLYDPREDDMWKGSDYLDKFRKRHMDGPRVLNFEPLVEPGEDVLHVQRILRRCWERIEGVETEDQEPLEQVRARLQIDDFGATTKEQLIKPEVRLMKLVATKPVTTTTPVVNRTALGAGVLD